MKLIKNNVFRLVICLVLLCFSVTVYALAYFLPENGNNVIGGMSIVQIKNGDTFHKLTRKHEMGYLEMAKSNKRIRKYGKIKAGKALVVPSFFVLPNAPRTGIIVNLPELRLYYFPPNHNVVLTEPVALGKLGWSTPLIMTEVLEKIKDPPWVVPESIMMASEAKGVYLPKVMPPGPKNPLGKFALRLGSWSILIHGTTQPHLIGKRVSSGCIRMYPEDIEHLFDVVATGTPVRIIDQPYKVGWLGDKLYLESHMPFLEVRDTPMEELNKVRQLILTETHNHPANIDWHAVVKTFAKHSGLPHVIGQAKYQ